jgi:hypothetical protein
MKRFEVVSDMQTGPRHYETNATYQQQNKLKIVFIGKEVFMEKEIVLRKTTRRS